MWLCLAPDLQAGQLFSDHDLINKDPLDSEGQELIHSQVFSVYSKAKKFTTYLIEKLKQKQKKTQDWMANFEDLRLIDWYINYYQTGSVIAYFNLQLYKRNVIYHLISYVTLKIKRALLLYFDVKKKNIFF